MSMTRRLSRWDEIEAAVAGTVSFLLSLRAPGWPRGVFRTSLCHEPDEWPGALLPGTYDALMALSLVGATNELSASDKTFAASFLKKHREADGRFRNSQAKPDDTFKRPERAETEGYMAFHLTNYSLGGLQALDDGDPPVLEFVRPFLDPARLDAWLARRDLRDPWLEGNNIVNLASFLILLAEQGGDDGVAARQALRRMIEWHEFLQEPATGFWGVGQTVSATQRLHAMAGATHNFHVYYALGVPIPYLERIVDYCLALPIAVQSACIDVDIVDILANCYFLTSYRRDDIRAWLLGKLDALLKSQNPDGGFADIREGVRRLDGWVRGYAEPQGLSNGFATFFRLIAIAMIGSVLWPGRRHWGFRRMLGIGYFPRYPENA
jgi:hypothetical protein